MDYIAYLLIPVCVIMFIYLFFFNFKEHRESRKNVESDWYYVFNKTKKEIRKTNIIEETKERLEELNNQYDDVINSPKTSLKRTQTLEKEKKNKYDIIIYDAVRKLYDFLPEDEQKYITKNNYDWMRNLYSRYLEDEVNALLE